MLHNYLVSNYQFEVTSVLNSELLGIRLLIMDFKVTVQVSKRINLVFTNIHLGLALAKFHAISFTFIYLIDKLDVLAVVQLLILLQNLSQNSTSEVGF